MSEPSEADRITARELVKSSYCQGDGSDDPDTWRIEAIATALAAEREKARAPFLALLDEVPNIQPLWEFERGALRGLEMAKSAIRRAAEEGQQ